MWKFIENSPCLRSITVFVATILFAIILIVTLIPILSILLFWRWILKLAAKCFQRGKLGKMVTSMSSIFAGGYLYSRKAVTMVVSSEVDSPTLNLKNMRTQVEKKLLSATILNTNELLYPELKSSLRPWMGFLFWAPCKNFDIKNHVMSLEEIDAPPYDSEDAMSQSRLISYLTRDRIWEKSRPLWEVILVEDKIRLSDSSNNKCFIIFRAHHALGDGWAAFKLVTRLLGNPDLLRNSATPKFKQGQAHSAIIAVLSRVWFWMKLPFETVDFLLTVAPDKTEIPPLEVSPICNGPDVFGVMEEIFPLDRLKRLKSKLGIDFHSLIVAGIASAVRQEYQDRGAKVPNQVKLTYPLPIPGHPDKLRNHMSVGFILLPIGEPDPIKRAKLIASRVQNGIRAGLPLPFSLLSRIIGSMPISMIHKLRGKAKVSPIMFTNIVGPSIPAYWEDKRITDIKFSTNLPYEEPGGYVYGVGIFTYCGRVNFGVTGLRHYFRDITHPKQFIERCVAEWEELEKSVADLEDDCDTPMTQIV